MSSNDKIKKFFDEASQTWDENNCDFSGARTIINTLKDYIKDKSVLDIGCGTGVLYPLLKEAAAKTITGIDISNKMIEVAKQKIPDANFICQDIYTWCPEQKYDVAIMYNVYPHFFDKNKLVEKLNNILTDDGVVIVAHGASREKINSHHRAHALGVSKKLMKAWSGNVCKEIISAFVNHNIVYMLWLTKIILQYFGAEKINQK